MAAASFLSQIDPNDRQRRRQQAADAASELSADDESSLADEDDDERTGAASTIDRPLVDGVQQRHSRRSRLTNGHAASNDSAFADANGDSQHNGSPLPSAQHGATPPKSRRVRLAQVTDGIVLQHMVLQHLSFQPCASAGWDAEPHGAQIIGPATRLAL